MTLEPLSADGAATRLHYDPVDAVVWLDTDVAARDGLVIGVGRNRASAIEDAIAELRARVADLERAVELEAS